MKSAHLNPKQRKSLVSAYESKDFDTIKILCFEYGMMVGCGNCEYSHTIAVAHIEQIQAENEHIRSES